MIVLNSQNHFSSTDLIGKLTDFFNKRNQDQPYNINVIDELHANENAHSRILGKLLEYRNSVGEYNILKSLLTYIVEVKEKDKFKELYELESQDLTIENEKDRIDLLLAGREYAIIFENKAKDAGDQPNQLARYIDKLLHRYQKENIYVVYLTSDEHDPSDQSWKNEKGDNYKPDFEGRYVNLSYKSDILPWIKDEVYPSCPIKEELLISALRQYIDHLEGMFWLRPSQQESCVVHGLLQASGYENHSDNELANVYELLCKLREITEVDATEETEDVVEVANTEDGLLGGFVKKCKASLVACTSINSVKNILENYINTKIKDANITFEQKSREILNQLYGNVYGNVEIKALLNGSNKRFLFAFPEKWGTSLLAVHLEWVDMKENHYVGKGDQDYVIELHFEQNTWTKYYNSSKKLIEQSSIPGLIVSAKPGKTVCSLSIKAKALCYMSDTEFTDFLNAVYNQLSPIVEAINQVIK